MSDRPTFLAPAGSPADVPPAQTPATPGLGVLVVIAVIAALYQGREVLVPFTLAILLSFLLTPLVELLRRLLLGRILSVVLAVVLALGIIAGLGTAIGTEIAQLAGNIPRYQSTITQKISGLSGMVAAKFPSRLMTLGSSLATAPQNPATALTAKPGSGEQPQQQAPVPVVVTQTAPSALTIGERVLAPIFSPLTTAGIILVVTIFALLQKEDLRDRAIRLFGSSDLHRTTAAMNDAGQRLSRYFLTQLGINTAFGAIVGTGVFFIGVPNPVLWGILGTLLRFIPYIGSWIAAALPIALAAAVAPGWSMAIWTAALYIVTELTMGQVVEPLVYGHSTGLSPVAVIVAAIFWAWLWGPIGLIISTPLTLCLVVLGRHIEQLEFFDVLLGDRPPLTPVESFYQRMLAGDPDEAEEQAEQYLKSRTLSSYYDEVVLKGLQLAAGDSARGILNGPRVARLREAVGGLVHDLDSHDDQSPSASDEKRTIAGPTLDQMAMHGASVAANSKLAPESSAAFPVICIAGRGALDEPISDMLAQLLVKHGLRARTVPYDAVSRSKIASFDPGDAAMVCISYLDIRGNPAHLRYLIRRLREKLPHAQILVGFWPPEDPALKRQEDRPAAAADSHVTSLREAVQACLSAAHREKDLT